jgi:hypothetical protein
VPPKAAPTLWAFSLAGGWKQTPDPIAPAWPDGATLLDRNQVADVKERAGWLHLATFGDEDGTLAVVIDQSEPPGAFLVEIIFTGSDGYAVLADDLPSLLELLGRLLPLSSEERVFSRTPRGGS